MLCRAKPFDLSFQAHKLIHFNFIQNKLFIGFIAGNCIGFIEPNPAKSLNYMLKGANVIAGKFMGGNVIGVILLKPCIGLNRDDAPLTIVTDDKSVGKF